MAEWSNYCYSSLAKSHVHKVVGEGREGVADEGRKENWDAVRDSHVFGM